MDEKKQDTVDSDSTNQGSLDDEHYRAEEFDALPYEEKLDIYYNFPLLLPGDFDPDVFINMFHPELENQEY